MSIETKIIKEKKLDKEKLVVKITKNDAAERIFVEFSSPDGRMKLQRSFQDTYYGREDAKTFEKSIKSIDALQSHFKR
jgi:hypothetical protein